ncbi:unnamed protein product [Sphagnum compactum]
MVVCKCRKATKLYCFVHKAPVCAECVCFPEHQFCVVKTYSDWVIDGDYDWPPKCSSCEQILEDENTATTRLGCLHILHSSCLQSHLQSFPPHTAPAGYVCPTCSTSVWPPNKFFKDSESTLYSRLKSVISETSVATTLLGSDISIQSTPTRDPPPAFAVGPLAEVAVPVTGSSEIELVVTSPSTTGVDAAHGSNDLGVRHVNHLQPGAMTRKSSVRGDKPNFGGHVDYEHDQDHDGSRHKYTRRGPAYRQIFKYLLPFWTPALPGLPVTAPTWKDGRETLEAEELIDGKRRRRQRSSTFDVRKVILALAIMSCMATAMLLYYRLAQSAGQNIEEAEDELGIRRV